MQAFSIRESIRFGWQKVRAHSALVFEVVLTMFALEVLSSLVQHSLRDTLIGAAASIVIAVAGVVLGAGMTRIFMELARGGRAAYRDIVPDIRLVWRYFAASFLSGLITFLPVMAGALVSLIVILSSGAVDFSTGAPVPGLEWAFALCGLVMLASIVLTAYFAMRYSFARLAALDGAGIAGSLRRSAALSRGIKWRLALFFLAIIGLNILGLIALLVGLLVTVPISLFALVHIYYKLKAHHGHH